MTKISRIPVNSGKWFLFLDDFWTALASCETKQEVKDFLMGMLTHTERKMFSKRFQIAMMLLLGYDYQAIRSRVKVSSATVAKINNLLSEEVGGVARVARRILKLKQEKLEKIEMPPEAKRKDLGQELVKAGLDFAYRAVKRKRKSISLKKS
jgi:uncharacterized protein YerC